MAESLGDIPAKRVSFKAQNYRLQGSLLIPEKAKGTNVLFIRGGAITFPAAQTFTEWQVTLADNRYASLFFDFPGSGGWTVGQLSDNTLKRRLEWSDAALSFLQTQHFASKVVVIGSSMGAPQAVALSVKHPELIKGIILSSGGMYSLEAEDKPFGKPLSEVLRKPQDYTKSPTVEFMRKLKIPSLVFYAEHDDVIPKEVQDLYRAVPKEVDFRIISDVGHKYLSPTSPAEKAARQFVYQTTNDFIDRLDRAG